MEFYAITEFGIWNSVSLSVLGDEAPMKLGG